MVVLTWVLQVVLFFVFWRLFLWITGTLWKSGISTSIWWTLGMNLIIAILLLVIFNNVHSAWWLMSIVGAIIGVFTAQVMHSGADS